MAKCLVCNHPHSDYDNQCFEALKNNCKCTPETFLSGNNDLKLFDCNYRVQVLAKIHDIHQKIEWMKKAIEETRNQDDWDFLTTMWKYAANFQFGDTWTPEVQERIRKLGLIPENVRRACQKVCHEELETLRAFENELAQIIKQEGEGSNSYWKVIEQIKEFWKNCKYIPNDLSLLKKKKIKESAIFEYSIQEIEDIYFSIKQRSLT